MQNRILKGKWLDDIRPHIKPTIEAVQKVAKISREMLDVYSSIKDKNYISFILGTTSVLGILLENLVDVEQNVEDFFNRIGARQICPSIDYFVYGIIKQANIPMNKVWSDNGNGDVDSTMVEEYNLGNSKVYFSTSGKTQYVNGVYVKDEEQFYKDISGVIENRIGRFLILENVTDFDSWGKKMELSKVPVSSDVYINSNSFNEDDIVNSVRKFFERGLNRSMLFFGPPGTGKSTLAVRVTNRLGGKILILDGNSINDRSSSSIFQAISVIDPTVILFDDLDRFHGIGGLLGDIERMNRMRSGHSKLVIATVNNIGSVPLAMRRPGRFDQSIEFLPPDEDARLKVLLAYAKQFDSKLAESQLKPLAVITEGMTQAYLREVILRAEVLGIEKIVEHIDQMKRVSLFQYEEEEEDNIRVKYLGEKNE